MYISSKLSKVIKDKSIIPLRKFYQPNDIVLYKQNGSNSTGDWKISLTFNYKTNAITLYNEFISSLDKDSLIDIFYINLAEAQKMFNDLTK